MQADCCSGIWARDADARLATPVGGQTGEAVTAARRICDARLQRNAGRLAMAHILTLGTRGQRARRFATGHETGALVGRATSGGARP